MHVFSVDVIGQKEKCCPRGAAMVHVRPDRREDLEEAGAGRVGQPPEDVEGHADNDGEEAKPPRCDDDRDLQGAFHYM